LKRRNSGTAITVAARKMAICAVRLMALRPVAQGPTMY
jgi:hypothetical protein